MTVVPPPPPEGYVLHPYAGAPRTPGAKEFETFFASDGSKYQRRYDTSTGIMRAEWWHDSAAHPHRGGGLPARIRWSESGAVEEEEWMVRGVPSRLDGPAKVRHYPDGSHDDHWIVGGAHTELAEVGLILAMMSPHIIETEVRYSVYGVLLAEGATTDHVVTALTAGIFSLDGVRAIAEGAPVEWALAFEKAGTS